MWRSASFRRRDRKACAADRDRYRARPRADRDDRGARPRRRGLFGADRIGDRRRRPGYPGNVDLATARSAADYITPRTPVRSEGNVSNRQLVEGVDLLIHTAKISRGNSGGPLVDQCGRVVGINSAITRADEGDLPFAFAISTRELARASRRREPALCLDRHALPVDGGGRRARPRRASTPTRKAAEANAAKEEAAALDRQLKQERADEVALAARENRIAFAGVLFCSC